MRQQVDVLVAGSGGSGLVAGLAAADAGATVLLAERAASVAALPLLLMRH